MIRDAVLVGGTSRWRVIGRAGASGRRQAPILAVSLLYAAALVLALTSLLAPARLSLSLAGHPPETVRVAWLLPGGTLWERGVRPGDAVLALDGRAPGPQRLGTWHGTLVVARTATGNIVAADARAMKDVGEVWPLLLLSPWFQLLGTLIVARAIERSVGYTAFALFAGAAFALAFGAAADRDQPLAALGECIALPLFAAAFARFFLTFPIVRGGRRLRWGILALPLLALVLGPASLRWPALYGAAEAVRSALLFCYLLLGAGLLVAAFFAAPAPATRRGLAIMCLSTVGGVLPFIVAYLVPALLGQPSLVSPEQAILALALLPAGFAYAILRHHTIEVPLLQRWLIRGLTWLLLISLYIAMASAIHAVLAAIAPAPDRGIILLAALALLVGLAGRRLHDHVLSALDGALFADRYEYRAALRALSDELAAAGDLEGLGTALPDRLCRLMNLRYAALLICDEDGPRLRAAAGACPDAIAPAIKVLAGETSGTLSSLHLEHGQPATLLAPLRTRDRLAGYLCLGPKMSGEPFRTDDWALLATIGGHLATVLHNTWLIGALRSQAATLEALNARLQRAQEEERARLAREIHDEPLQTALHARRYVAESGRGREATHRTLALLDAVVGQLRALCLSTRPSALDELGLSAALELLALDLAAHAGIPIVLDAEPEVQDATLPRGADLVLYRAAQEAINNALRHGRPSRLTVRLQHLHGSMRLTVADDGIGFVMPASLDGLAAAGHLGLAGLQRRVRGVGGQLAVSAAPGAGTIVTADLPLISDAARARAGDGRAP